MSQGIEIPGKSRRTNRAWDDGTEKPSFTAARSMKRKLLAELCAGAQDENPVRPEDLLPRWPSDPGADPDVASLLFEDFRQRSQRGEQPSIKDYDQRFPEHKDSIASLFHHHDFLRSVSGASASSGPTLALPSVGDELFGFRLRQELGSGAFARVFLAEQADLAGRLVVLKTSDTSGDEPQTLAQLQHTHIVPIHSVHEDRQAGLRAVCMPYFGGASLSRILQRLWAETAPATTGEQFVQALAAVSNSLSLPPDKCERVGEWESERAGERSHASILPRSHSPTLPLSHCPQGSLPLLGGFSYIQAAAWIVARLAEGLQHAHQRGVLHRDIKPSNILIGADGQAMLLDFNLAHNRNADQAQAAATLGGTVAYMAPEHLRALASRDPNLVRLVDQRSDIYALGMVLYEMLTGHNPFDQSGSYSPLPVMIEAMAVERSRNVPSLRQRRPDVPWTLESIARKCLAPDQGQRYQQAEHLADDLQRFLEDQALKYAPELSHRERLRKWLRRHPRLTSSGSVATAAALLLIAAGVALVGVRDHLVSTQQQLEVSQAQERKRAYEEGTVRALFLVNTTTDLRDHLQEGLDVCAKTLGLYGVLERQDWQDHPEWQRLDTEERQPLAEDTRELLLLLAWARVQKAPGDKAVVHEALALLDRAEAIRDLKPSPALWHDRVSYLKSLGDSAGTATAEAMAKQIEPSSAHDHYLLATTFIRNGGDGKYAKALAELDRALELNPRHYWSHTQKGICLKDIGELTLAAGEFGTCIGLWPDFAWGYFNRGYILQQSGKNAEAIADYTAALKCNPYFVDAYINRGLTYLESKAYARALADCERAAKLGRDDASVHAWRGVALEGLGQSKGADAAFREAFARLQDVPPNVRDHIRLSFGFAVAPRLADKAQQAFVEVLQEHPDHPQALYGRGMLLVEQGAPEEALRWFNRVLEVAPTFVEARRARAILWARRGNFEGASQDINWCLEKESHSGFVLYGAACVTALMAEKATDDQAASQAAEQALTLLQKALAHGYGQEKAAHDPDLAGIRNRPEFQRLLKKEKAKAER